MKEILKSLRLVFSLAIPYLIWFIPRSPRIWIYGGRNGKFVDNTKYWFLWNNKHETTIKHIWISTDSSTISMLRNNNFKAFKPFTLKGIYYILRAKIAFYTHGATSIVRPIFLKKAIKFDFFHGIPLKTMGVQSIKVFQKQFGPNFKYNISRKLYNFYQKKYVYNDYLVIPSILFINMFMDFSGKRILTGYPRNIVFQLNESKLLEIIKLNPKDFQFYEEIHRYSKRYIYMPTFREGKPDFVREAFDDLQDLNELMIEQDALFLLKLHPYTKTKIDLEQYSNLMFIDNELDIYPFLPFISCLISDYSSISLDYYFSNKKVVFYVFDINEFIKTSRKLDFNPIEIAEESTALNWQDFLALLKNVDRLPLLSDQQGKEIFLSHIKPDLKGLSKTIKQEILEIN